MILPLLRAGFAWRNRVESDYGFPSLDGGTTPAKMIDVFEIPAGVEVHCRNGWILRSAADAAPKRRSACLLDRRRPTSSRPPPGTKAVLPDHVSFDDRTYVRVRL